jgi:twinkle protein
MSRETLWAAAEWVNQHFWRIDAARDDQDSGYGVVTLPEIVQRIESCVLRRGITMVYIDPWNRMESSRPNGMTETEYVAWAVNMLHRLAQRHNLFLMLVAHPHKVENEDVMISPYQISGSAHWYNMADVIIGVQRNKRADPKDRTTVAILKHREEGVSGHLGETYFHFDGRRSRFYTDIHQMPMDTGTAPFMALPFDPAASGGGNAPRTQI